MTAEEKIRFTIAEYCHRTDSGDFDGWVKLFAEDGGFRMFGKDVVGHAALRTFIDFLRSDSKIQRSTRALLHDPGKPVRDLIRSVPT